MTKPFDLVPQVPAVWPFGEGVLMTGHGVINGTPVLLVRAVPDSLVLQRQQADGKPSREDWDKCSESPELKLIFKDLEALDKLLDTLESLRDKAKKSGSGPREPSLTSR